MDGLLRAQGIVVQVAVERNAAGAMVACVRRLPIGADLATLDKALRQLGAYDPAELTTSERRVAAMLLRD